MSDSVNISPINHEVQRYLQAVNDPSKVIRANGKIENKVWAAIKDFFTRLIGQEPVSTKFDASVIYISGRLTSQSSYKGVDLNTVQTLMNKIKDRVKSENLLASQQQHIDNLVQQVQNRVQQVQNAERLQGLSACLKTVNHDLKNPDKLDLNFYRELLPNNRQNTNAMVNYESLEKTYREAYLQSPNDKAKQSQAQNTLKFSLQLIQGDLENQIDDLKK